MNYDQWCQTLLIGLGDCVVALPLARARQTSFLIDGIAVLVE